MEQLPPYLPTPLGVKDDFFCIFINVLYLFILKNILGVFLSLKCISQVLQILHPTNTNLDKVQFIIIKSECIMQFQLTEIGEVMAGIISSLI